MDRVPTRMWTLGAPDDVRLRQREALFVWVRWVFVGVAALASLLDSGRSVALALAVPFGLAAVNVVAVVGPRRLSSVRGLVALGVVVNLGDLAVATASLFNYSLNSDTATPLLLMLVVIEAAMRWELVGGSVGGALAGAVSTVWMLEREASAGIDFRFSTALARFGAYVLTGSLLGGLIRQLERAGREVQGQISRTEAVNRFALEAPRLDVEEAARHLATMLHEDLDFDRAAVVVVSDDDPSMFRLVATAGYDDAAVQRYQEFPVTVGVVGRCFRTGEPQLLADVAEDPDYLNVDGTTRSEMAVPLRTHDAVIGVIDVASSELGAFVEDDLVFLQTVGVQVGRAFDNARLAEIERRTIRELEELAVMKDDFIAIANHELRTPVTTIAGFAQSLLKQRDVLSEEEKYDAIERIARQSARLRSLIEDLLTVPRRPAGPRPLELQAIDLREVAEEVVRELDPLDGRHVLRVDVDSPLPPVAADPAALRRVLTNLLSNAVKYSDEGHVVVTAQERDGDVHVEVVDEGVGIAPEDIPSLFRKFGRISGHQRLTAGMGLGLFIVKTLVQDMGGQVGVESTPGVGSRFWFTLRAAPAPARPVDDGPVVPGPSPGPVSP